MSFSTRFLLVFLGMVSVFASTAGLRAADVETRCFELRIYTANPGKLADLHARFRNQTMRLFEKHGITNVAYFEPIENPERKLVYILAYPSKEARDASWREFEADPEWQKAKDASEEKGALVGRITSKFLQPTDFSPVVKPGMTTEKRIFELRTYVASPGNLDNLINRARANTEWLFKAYNVTGLAYWTVMPNQPGADDSLIYLLAHTSVQEGEAAFRKMRADPKWLAIKAESEKEAGGSLTLTQEGIVSTYLSPTDYSPLK